jgi:hypothetical protein
LTAFPLNARVSFPKKQLLVPCSQFPVEEEVHHAA